MCEPLAFAVSLAVGSWRRGPPRVEGNGGASATRQTDGLTDKERPTDRRTHELWRPAPHQSARAHASARWATSLKRGPKGGARAEGACDGGAGVLGMTSHIWCTVISWCPPSIRKPGATGSADPNAVATDRRATCPGFLPARWCSTRLDIRWIASVASSSSPRPQPTPPPLCWVLPPARRRQDLVAAPFRRRRSEVAASSLLSRFGEACEGRRSHIFQRPPSHADDYLHVMDMREARRRFGMSPSPPHITTTRSPRPQCRSEVHCITYTHTHTHMRHAQVSTPANADPSMHGLFWAFWWSPRSFYIRRSSVCPYSCACVHAAAGIETPLASKQMHKGLADLAMQSSTRRHA